MRRWLFTCGLIWLSAAPAAAAAQVDLLSQPELVVLLASRQYSDKTKIIVEATKAQLADLPVRFEVRWKETLPSELPEQEELASQEAASLGAIAVIWCDLKLNKNVYFYFATTDSHKVLVRRLDGVGPEGVADALAIISRSYIEGLLEGATIDMHKPPPTAIQLPPDTAPAPAPAAAPVHIALVLAYGLEVMSQKHGAINSALLALEIAIGPYFAAFLGYGITQGLEKRSPELALDIVRHPLQLGARLHGNIGRVSLGGSLALVGDFVRKEPRALAPNVVAEASYTSFALSIQPMIRGEVQLVDTISLFAAAGVEVPLEHVEYEVTSGSTLFNDLWAVTPVLWIGATVMVL